MEAKVRELAHQESQIQQQQTAAAAQVAELTDALGDALVNGDSEAQEVAEDGIARLQGLLRNLAARLEGLGKRREPIEKQLRAARLAVVQSQLAGLESEGQAQIKRFVTALELAEREGAKLQELGHEAGRLTSRWPETAPYYSTAARYADFAALGNMRRLFDPHLARMAEESEAQD